MAVLLIRQHRDLQPLASETVSFLDGEQPLPPKLVRQIDAIVENKEAEEVQATSWRGAGWPKWKAKAKGKAKSKSTRSPNRKPRGLRDTRSP